MRQVEVFEASPVEKELLWAKWQKEWGIKKVLFDLDGTLADTYAMFLPIVEQGKRLLMGDDPDNLRQYFESINGTSLNSWGVNPIRWNWIVDEMQSAFGIDNKACELAKNKFEELYKTPIKLNAGALETMNFLRTIGTEFGIVTHANKIWTDKKIEWLGFDEFIPRRNIYVVNENGPKGPDQWKEALSHFGLVPREAMVVGDSPKSDIAPCKKIGVPNRFWYTGKGSDNWIAQREELSGDTWRIESLTELMDLGGELLRHKMVVG